MDLKGRKRSEWTRLLKSFSFAWDGIKTALREERNFQIHLIVAVVVLFAAFWFELTRYEWIIILFLITGMLSLELMNTAVERVVDLVTKEYKPLAKYAKDTAAAAVLLYAVLSIIVGFIIFLPKLIN
ncbi:diacylglycerol kinase family protein [Metabacillus arenae]|uniref:Diacylglycerol kinase family protein n=1 Tax=Metabacillus arenae TaxID=2771434 RepID=A0A926NK69_9BACI|nr:diacylglycerol kinase family protein [Metabacillus arenae]MBD1382108.1 diacylglycerol kinase family protein [Metabacillus arenae]